MLDKEMGDHGEAAGGCDGAADTLEGASSEQPVEGCCVGEDHRGGELDAEAHEHWYVMAHVIYHGAAEGVDDELDEGLGGEEEADGDVVAAVFKAHVGIDCGPID